MKVRFLTDRTDGIEAGDIVDLDPAEAERVLRSGAAEPIKPARGKRGQTENHMQDPAGETR